MGQLEIIEFLKKNKGKYFSPEEISKEINVHFTAVYEDLKGLEKEGEVYSAFLESKATKRNRKMYAFQEQQDPVLTSVFKEFEEIKKDRKFEFINRDMILQMLILSELKKLGRQKNESKK